MPIKHNRDIPFLTADQMREVDRAMVQDFGILLVQMMENAGRGLAHLARSRFLDGDPAGKRILVLAGTGGNGGGGLVCARWLHNWGAEVLVWLTASPSQLAEVPRHQLNILERKGIHVELAGDKVDLPAGDLIVDAIIGYSLRGSPAGMAASLILAADSHGAPVLALDVPSGLDATEGTVYEPATRATVTLTLALPKKGLAPPGAREHVGELYLADIGVSPELYERPPLFMNVGPIFAPSEIIRIW